MASNSSWNPFYSSPNFSSEDLELDFDLLTRFNQLRLNVEACSRFWGTPVANNGALEYDSPFQLPSPWAVSNEELLALQYPKVAENSQSTLEEQTRNLQADANQLFRDLVDRVLYEVDVKVLKNHPPNLDSNCLENLPGSSTATASGMANYENVIIELIEYPPGLSYETTSRRLRKQAEKGISLENNFDASWKPVHEGGCGSTDLDDNCDLSQIYSSNEISWESFLTNSSTSISTGSGESRNKVELHFHQDRNNEEVRIQQQFEPLVPMPVTLKAEDLFVYPTQRSQFIFTECSFVVQILSSRKWESSYKGLPMGFRAVFVDQTGIEHDAFIKPVPMVDNMFFCSFFPFIPGCYEVAVFVDNGADFGTREHVKGSPFTLRIGRNYDLESMRIRLRMGISGVVDSGRNRCRCWGITSDKLTDNIYITNREKHDVTVFNALGQFMFKFGQDDSRGSIPWSSGQSNLKLYRPTGIACDSINRRLFVADKDNHRVVIYSLDGIFISSFGELGHRDGQFMFPWDVDCTADGERVVVSDAKNHRIQLFDRLGNFLKKFSIFETSPFDYKHVLDHPRALSFDHEGKKIYVTDFGQDAVVCINAEMTEASKFYSNPKLGRLQGLTVDAVGNVIVCDTRRNLIRVINQEGQIVSLLQTLGKVPLFQPLDVTVMRGGFVAVMDHNGRIRKF